MPNVIDYVNWRGDLLIENEPINNADRLLFSILSYLPFDGLVPYLCVDYSITLEEVGKKLLEKNSKNERKKNLSENQIELLNAIMESDRFKDLRLTCYRNIHSEKYETQFSAITFLLPDNTVFVAYRGTDGSLIGWKENFNLSFMDVVPAEALAQRYLNEVASNFMMGLRVAGHSKGGNLAVYAAMMSNNNIQNRIIEITNLDGPGFNKETVSSFPYCKLQGRIKTYVPTFDIVGMLLCHEEDYIIIESSAKGLLQHDPFTWEIMGNDFVIANELDKESVLITYAINDWINTMTFEQREALVDDLYQMLLACRANTLKELCKPENKIRLLVEIAKKPEGRRKILDYAFSLIEDIFK